MTPSLLSRIFAEIAWDPRKGLALPDEAVGPREALGALRDHLYARYFCRWSPGRSGTSPAAAGDPAFAARLVAAAGGARYWSDEWEAVEAGATHAFVTDGRITLFVDDLAEIRPRSPVAGQPVRLRLPCARPSLAPGFFYLVGPAGRFERSQPYPRLYLNVRPAAVPSLVRALLAEFGRRRIRFEAKFAGDPAGYRRVDPAVLYASQADLGRAVAAVRAVAAAHPGWWRAGTPLFTLPLGRGIAAAECPAEGAAGAESFGQHRCGLLATGVLAALRAGDRRPMAALRHVTEAFSAAGVDLARPYAQRIPLAVWRRL
ncbi:MAG: hypothetical protein FJZ01_06450 [Candidatus Sericytochromatia bacterium]|nr:hypothetical protein [Candidatus Tanganyikabacteria bacterium]